MTYTAATMEIIEFEEADAMDIIPTSVTVCVGLPGMGIEENIPVCHFDGPDCPMEIEID